MAIYEKHLEMNTCVIWPSVVSNRICQTRVRLVHNLYESKHHWAQSWLPGNLIMRLSRFSLPDFPRWSLQLHPTFGGKDFVSKQFCLSAYTFHCFSFHKQKVPERVEKKYQLGLVKYLFHSVRCFMNWAIYVTELIFILNTAVVFICEILWLKMTHVYLTELFHNKHLFCV